MSSKTVFSEFFSKEDYEKELDKSLKLGCVEHALLFYHFCQYCTLKEEDFISNEKYYELCDFLADNLHTLPLHLQQHVVLNDIMIYDCKLQIEKDPNKFEKGKHVLLKIEDLLEILEARIDIDFKLEVIEELDSVN
jgi:hypothetical protein